MTIFALLYVYKSHHYPLKTTLALPVLVVFGFGAIRRASMYIYTYIYNKGDDIESGIDYNNNNNNVNNNTIILQESVRDTLFVILFGVSLHKISDDSPAGKSFAGGRNSKNKNVRKKCNTNNNDCRRRRRLRRRFAITRRANLYSGNSDGRVGIYT